MSDVMLFFQNKSITNHCLGLLLEGFGFTLAPNGIPETGFREVSLFDGQHVFVTVCKKMRRGMMVP